MQRLHENFSEEDPTFRIIIEGVDLLVQSTIRLDIMVVPKSHSIQWENKDPTVCHLLIFRKNLQLIPDVKDTDIVFISTIRRKMQLEDL